MPDDEIYIRIHAGKKDKASLGYIGDETGINISSKNPNYCELTALLRAWENVDCDYIGLVHYQRHFKNIFFRFTFNISYTQIVEKMLFNDLIDVELGKDFFEDKEEYLNQFPKVVYSGMIDQFFEYQYGVLEYRSLTFETKILNQENFQGNAVVNYTDVETPYTRIIEHKHFEFGDQPKTIITKEYPRTRHKGDEPYYPVNDSQNNENIRNFQNKCQILFLGAD